MKVCSAPTQVYPSASSDVLYAGHRMYSISDNNPRVVLNDSIFPIGGRRDGIYTILVRKGEYISFNVYCLHQDEDIWGADVTKFRLKRWKGQRSLWNFIPFGRGSRICPA